MKELTQKTTNNETIPVVYFNMFVYKLMGLNYKQIAQRTGYSHDHIRKLFSKGHVCHELWERWREDFILESVETGLNMMFAWLPDIVRKAIEVALESETMAGVKQRRTILEYTLGNPKYYYGPEHMHKLKEQKLSEFGENLLKGRDLKGGD